MAEGKRTSKSFFVKIQWNNPDFRMGSMTSINSGSINIGMDLSEEERKKFSDTMREMLAEMEPVCQEEQSFIINFFHLTGENTNIPV